MALKLYSDTDIQNIADAIRSKNGLADTYKVSEMADAISAISGGGITPTGTKSIGITANGITTEDVANYASAEITTNVPNSYSASDEGKVVNGGALVAQSSQSITENGTYDTTLKNEVVVNVQSGGGGSLLPAYNISAITVSFGTGSTEVKANLPDLRSLSFTSSSSNTTEVIDIEGIVGGEVSIINGGNAQNNSGALRVINLHGANAVLPASNYGLRYRTNLETVNAKIRCLVTNTGNQFTGSTKLKDLYWQENAQTVAVNISACPLTDDSLISLANGLSETTTATVTLSSARKTTCGTIVGKSVEVTGDTTYHRFVEDANETLTLTEFITTVKGWTLA